MNGGAGWYVLSIPGWPFLRKLAESGAVQWTEHLSMAQMFDTKEEAEAEAFKVCAYWGMTFNLQAVPEDEAKEYERKFKLANHLT